ncbi:non-secretory ribonuclease-like [Sus scrofa]|uniref:Non-secretory ribonuclease-like n=2 Tax=Sus scrofa TaxID=9823 RepID=A0A8D1GIP5_PIG|nr:non-secretory ribonuclease-like [Sus scrofa]
MVQRDSRLGLFLLLGLLGVVISLHVPPGGLTWAQWFTIQHINMTRSQCDPAMRAVNRYRGVCKGQNTFLHTSFARVARVCYTRNITCPRSGWTNCHESSFQVAVTHCNRTRNAPHYTDCRYARRQVRKRFIIACNVSSPRDDPRYPVVPVHLDEII